MTCCIVPDMANVKKYRQECIILQPLDPWSAKTIDLELLICDARLVVNICVHFNDNAAAMPHIRACLAELPPFYTTLSDACSMLHPDHSQTLCNDNDDDYQDFLRILEEWRFIDEATADLIKEKIGHFV